jgi:hypothetical protein
MFMEEVLCFHLEVGSLMTKAKARTKMRLEKTYFQFRNAVEKVIKCETDNVSKRANKWLCFADEI